MWMTMVLLAAGLSADSHDLSLRLTASKSRILVGEPLKVWVSWTARQPVPVNFESVRLMVSDGSGFHQHSETRTQTSNVIRTLTLNADETRVSGHVLSVEGGGLPPSSETRFRFAFPKAGRYRVRADYYGAKSNEVTIDVQMPEGNDAELYAKHLRARPELLTEWALLNLRSQGDADLVAKLLDQYKGSPYLSRLRVLSWEQEIGRALSTHYEVQGRERNPLQGEPGALLQQIESEVLDGPFDEDRLALVARKRLDWDDREGAARLYREILSKHPHSQAADEARAMLPEVEVSLQKRP